MMPAGLITAMLAPLRIKCVQLDGSRLAPESLDDSLQLVVPQRDVRSSGELVNQAQLPAGRRQAAAATHRRAERSNARWPASGASVRTTRCLRAREALHTPSPTVGDPSYRRARAPRKWRRAWSVTDHFLRRRRE